MIKQFIVFCGVGGINTAIGLAAILFFSEILNFHYMTANALGYAVGLGAGFVLHKKLTFNNEGRALPQLGAFTAVFGIAYAAQFALLTGLVDFVGMKAALAQILAVGLYTVISYFGHKFVTFKKRDS